ncbi:hypothetical protein PGB28_03885 [Primorskyibacter aestuariivivens]|uniref:hypothetical protein n=1 Tax=Primorskyibacter aestuariivivens TaxID=1888912 RepID=UPI0023004521|nr:hypothetical protein [Primorskyibacter aestuariivivens]MDA7427588.1 hypothetical protein [Primorskyibacter aestuariivivens]
MTKLMIASLFAGFASGAMADDAKPKMSAEEFEQQVIVSTLDTTGREALIVLTVVTMVALITALTDPWVVTTTDRG